MYVGFPVLALQTQLGGLQFTHCRRLSSLPGPWKPVVLPTRLHIPSHDNKKYRKAQDWNHSNSRARRACQKHVGAGGNTRGLSEALCRGLRGAS